MSLGVSGLPCLRSMADSARLYSLFTGAPDSYRDFIDAIFRERVASVFAHVPFYRNFMRARGLRAQDFRDIGSLRQFPIIGRGLLQSSPSEAFLHGALRADELPAASYTSGTSGAPLKLYATRDFYVSSFYILQRSYGGALPFRVACVSDDDRALPCTDGCQVHFVSRALGTEAMYQRLAEIEPHAVMMRPDRWRLLLEDRAHACASLRLTFAGVSGAATTRSERAHFAELLGCPVINMYGATELGGAIFECPAGRDHVLSHQNYLEVVDEDGRQVAPGETGRLAWTTLDNALMPLVRYVVGDTGTFSPRQACSCGWNGPIVDAIGPRTKEAVIFPSGTRTSFHVFNVAIHKNAGSRLFRQYRVVQESATLLRLLVVKSRSFEDGAMHALLAQLRALLRGELALEVQYVDRIAESGNKYRFFVPLGESTR